MDVPAKRALVRLQCPTCRAVVPLAGLVTDAACSACDWRGAVVPDRWDWVVGDEPQTVAGGHEILGETVACDVTCRRCGVVIAEPLIAQAVSARAPSVACVACRQPMAIRGLPAGALRPRSWQGAHASVALGEGAVLDAPVNVPCSSCGAPLVVDGTTPAPACVYCHVRTPLPQHVWRALRPPGGVHPFFLWMDASAAKAALAHRAMLATRRRLVWIVLALVGLAAVGGVVALVVHLQRVAAAAPPHGFAVENGDCYDQKAACSLDKKALLHCETGKMSVAMTCHGPAGCRVDGEDLHCDYTNATPGEPCDIEDFTCSADGKSQLRCDGAHWSVSNACKGPDGCTMTPRGKSGYSLSCDYNVADVGDACMKNDQWACSSDMKANLRCAEGHFALAQACKGPKGCTVTKNRGDDTTTVACDSAIADLGDVCFGEGGACSTDGHSMLKCDHGQFARAHACPRGCTVDKDDNELTCR
jgi:hypothetical protein